MATGRFAALSTGALLLVGFAPALNLGRPAGAPASQARSAVHAKGLCARPDFSSIAATSSSNVWAVGSCDDTGGLLAEHYDGSDWNAEPVPPPGYGFLSPQLYGVATASPSSAWIVGDYQANPDQQSILIERWNGRAWKLQTGGSSPRLPSNVSAGLSGVAATSVDDAWTVGSVAGDRALIEHWNGKTWTVQRPAQPGIASAGYALGGISAVFGHVAYAVGSIINYWNGRAWRFQQNPYTYGTSGSLGSVSTVSATVAWAVSASDSSGPPVVLRRGKRGWAKLPLPVGGGKGTFRLDGVAARSARSAWVIGTTSSSRLRGKAVFIDYWNGRRWSLQKLVSAASTPDLSAAIAAVSRDDAWAAAGQWVLHWNGRRWTTVLGP